MNYIPEIEFASQDAIKKFQFTKLTELLEYVTQYSPFYRSHFQKHAITPASIKDLDDLVKIPVTTKNDLQQNNLEFLCTEQHKIAEYTSTSGTLGKPVIIALSANDVQRLAYNEALSFSCADGSSEDRYQLMLTLDRQFMAGIAYYEGIRKLGGGLIRTGPGLPAMQWETIEQLRPTTLVGVPSFIVKLIDYAQQHNIDFSKTAVKKIVCIGENIRDADLRPNVLAKKITSAWNVHLYGTYASTEMQTAFTECAHGTGGHHHPELLIVEIVDENNEPVQNGEAGEVCVTTLGIEAMPLIRYRTGDVARMYTEKCACGRTTVRLGPILGRKQQMLKLKGTTVYPPAIFDVLNQQPGIEDYAVEAVTGSLGTDELKVYVITGQEKESIEKQLVTRFQSILRVVPEIIFTDIKNLERLQGIGQSRKIKRFLDSRLA